jgi:RNA polymerase sigma-70 factor, ECF subfamily
VAVDFNTSGGLRNRHRLDPDRWIVIDLRDDRRAGTREHIREGRDVTIELSDIDIAIRDGDQSAFSAFVERHRRELQVHCYRMVGSLQDAEDMVQETFLRAWANRSSYEGRSSFRAWLYRIATNACLDLIKRRRRVVAVDPSQDAPTEVTWLEPFPDSMLPRPDDPAAAAVARETIELAYIAAIQHLPPRQRAVLLLRDAVGWSAQETAELLETSIAAVNSALQRARATLSEQVANREERTTWWQPTEEERRLLARFMDATERADMAEMAALLKEDAIFWMPPEPGVFSGRDAIVESWTPALTGPARIGEFKMVPTRCNNQLAAANYVRAPGEDTYERLALDVLRIEDGQIAEVIAFPHSVFDTFGLPDRF